ncbi:hypothetical protein SALBM311S_09700 [Streptomyces alboniger]
MGQFAIPTTCSMVSGWFTMASMWWATSARGTGEPAPDVAVPRGPVRAGQGLVGEFGRARHRPLQSTVAQDLLGDGEVGVVPAEHGPGQRDSQVAHEEAVAGIVPGWRRPARHRHRPDGCSADDDDPPDVLGLHRRDNRAGTTGGDARVRARVSRAERGQYGVGVAYRRGERAHVGVGEVDGDRPDAARQLTRAAGHGGDFMPAGYRLLDQVPSDTAGGGDDREFHRGPPAVKAARWSCAQVAYVRAGRPSSRRTVSVVGPASRA